ncbi:hypothetical protein Misp06_03684 [Microbulbifer sp. NBRC 101763]
MGAASLKFAVKYKRYLLLNLYLDGFQTRQIDSSASYIPHLLFVFNHSILLYLIRVLSVMHKSVEKYYHYHHEEIGLFNVFLHDSSITRSCNIAKRVVSCRAPKARNSLTGTPNTGVD